MKTRKSAVLVIYFIGAYMFACLLLGVALLIYRPGVSEGLVASMIGGPMTTALGFLGGMLSKTEDPENVDAVTVQTSQPEIEGQ